MAVQLVQLTRSSDGATIAVSVFAILAVEPRGTGSLVSFLGGDEPAKYSFVVVDEATNAIITTANA